MTERRKTAGNGGDATHAAAAARRAKGIAMILGGARHAEVAEACGVSVRQVERWSALPEVREQAATATPEAIATARGVLDAAAREAAEALVGLMRDPNGSPGDRLRATLAVLDRTGNEAGTKVEHRVLAGLPANDNEALTRFAELSRRERVRNGANHG